MYYNICNVPEIILAHTLLFHNDEPVSCLMKSINKTFMAIIFLFIF